MPRLVMVGVSHHAAPVEIREHFAFDETVWRAHAPSTVATVLLSTCNRVEVYAWAHERPAATLRSIERALSRASGLTTAELAPYVCCRTGSDAVLHLVRVTSGLDSLVVGEEQIRGQVRQALRDADRQPGLPSPLRGIFERAGESARRVRTGTRLGAVPSVAAAGVSVAARLLPGGLRGQQTVVLGAGVMARAAAEALLAHGASVQVLNRTPAHADGLVSRLGARVTSGALDCLDDALREAVLVVGSTASKLPIVRAADVSTAASRRLTSTPLVVLDIALPRDVDPDVRTLPGVTLIDLDDLERMCPVDVGTRHAELAHAETLAAAEADRIGQWLRGRAVSPAIAELRTYAEGVRTSELRRSAARLRDLTPEQVAAVDALTASIVNKLMHGPTVALRHAATQPGGLGRSPMRILRALRSSRGRSA